MICKQCEHPLDWHGDRAITACDGGWNDLSKFSRFRRSGEPVSLCACTGWTD